MYTFKCSQDSLKMFITAVLFVGRGRLTEPNKSKLLELLLDSVAGESALDRLGVKMVQIPFELLFNLKMSICMNALGDITSLCGKICELLDQSQVDIDDLKFVIAPSFND
jgi:hypothetical protein